MSAQLQPIEHATSRDDVYYMIGQMIAELNVGHAYIWTWSDGLESRAARRSGLLGCDFELARDATATRLPHRDDLRHRGAGSWTYDAPLERSPA